MRSVTRRTVVKLAYAAPMVAATMKIAGVKAMYGSCDCYDPRDGFFFSNIGGACEFADPNNICGQCATCYPELGANCPPGTRGIGGQTPACIIRHDEHPECKPVYYGLCGFPFSQPRI